MGKGNLKEKIKNKKRGRRRDKREGRNEEIFFICSIINRAGNRADRVGVGSGQ